MLVGFLGLGLVGQPMALNLAHAGTPLLVWNRTATKTEPLRSAGAAVATSPSQVFRQAELVILMLSGPAAVDAVLQRGHDTFARNVGGCIVVQMGTTSPAYSARLGTEIRGAGGTYVEAPVSGSRKPAEAGELIALLAGAERSIEIVRPVLAPMCRHQFVCGDPPNGSLMKLAVNLYLITMVTGLCEAFHFACRQGLDPRLLRAVLEAGPMASSVSRVKLQKLSGGDWEAQAAAADVHYNSQLVAEAARAAGIASPVLDVCESLYDATVRRGDGHLDMITVLHAIEALSTDKAATPAT